MVDNPIQVLATRLGCVTGLGELLLTPKQYGGESVQARE